MSTCNRLYGFIRRRTDIIGFRCNYCHKLHDFMDSALLATHDNYCNRRQPDSSALPGLWSLPRYPAWNMTPFAYCLQSRTWLVATTHFALRIPSDHAILHIIIQQIKRPRLTRSSKERETRHLTHFPSFNDVALIIRFRSPTSVSINNTLHHVLDIILVRLAKCGMGKGEWSAPHENTGISSDF